MWRISTSLNQKWETKEMQLNIVICQILSSIYPDFHIGSGKFLCRKYPVAWVIEKATLMCLVSAGVSHLSHIPANCASCGLHAAQSQCPILLHGWRASTGKPPVPQLTHSRRWNMEQLFEQHYWEKPLNSFRCILYKKNLIKYQLQ